MRARPLLSALLACAVLCALALAGVGEMLTRPHPSPVGAPPSTSHVAVVRLPTDAGAFMAGWFSPGQRGRGAVLLLHSIGADRRQMLARAQFLQAAGYAVLLVDLPAHGESPGERITFGWREAAGVRAALGFLQTRLPGERIGVIGHSLGAAAFVFANAAQPTADAVVLEAMYPTLREAVVNRLAMRLGNAAAHVLAPALLWQLPLRLGVTEDQLRPIDALRHLRAPVLIISGTQDRHTTADETRRLFEAAPAPKELWLVEGAAHVDLHGFAREAYEARVLDFLQRHLQGDSTQPR